MKSLALFLLIGLCQGQRFDYRVALDLSIKFYEAQRSGDLDESTNRIDWRGDSAMGDAVTGGYYDAGDHVKFGFPFANAMTILAWGGITFESGYAKSGDLSFFSEQIKWGADYILNAHDESARTLVGQIGDSAADHNYWGRPEQMTMARPAYSISMSNCGSELAAESAAALASASIFFSDKDAAYSSQCLSEARLLYDMANSCRGIYTASIPDAQCCYASWSGYMDDLIWGAIWMYKATGEIQYLNDAEQHYRDNGNYIPTSFDWDNKLAGAQMLLFEATQEQFYFIDMTNYIDYIRNRAPYTPNGLIYLNEWGSTREAANVAHWCAQAMAMGYLQIECETFIENQINYILGDGNPGFSYQIGFGPNWPQRPHHRGASCEDMPAPCDWNDFNKDAPNGQVLEGALVGGPNQTDFYSDQRDDYVHNEVALDYNAGFQSVLAYLVEKYY